MIVFFDDGESFLQFFRLHEVLRHAKSAKFNLCIVVAFRDVNVLRFVLVSIEEELESVLNQQRRRRNC